MKKILALFLSVVMVFSVTIPAFAEGEDAAADYSGYPVVIVRGIDFMNLINLDDGSKAMKVRAFDILDLIFDIGAGAFIRRDEKALPKAIVDFVWDFMGPVASNPDGTSKNNVGMKQFFSNVADFPELAISEEATGEFGVLYSVSQAVGRENTYYFTYDWRKSPEKLAAELNKMVEIAKEQSKKDKVHIACCSMGGMVTTAYMYYYGYESLDSVTYLSAANNGTYVCGDALNGAIKFSPETLENTLIGMGGDGVGGFIVKLLVKLLGYLRITDTLCDFLNSFIANNKEYAYGDCLRDIFGTALGLWALCPDEQYATGVDFIFTGYEEEYAELLVQLEEIEKFVCSTEETTLKAYNSGVKIAILSNYNKPLTPVSDSAFLNGDGALETELTSSFATVAPYGETLSDEYIATRDSKYISPDKVIDASTCLFPESTWFIRNAGHVASRPGSDYSDLIVKLILSEKQPNIADYPEYPRFMTADAELNLTLNS